MSSVIQLIQYTHFGRGGGMTSVYFVDANELLWRNAVDNPNINKFVYDCSLPSGNEYTNWKNSRQFVEQTRTVCNDNDFFLESGQPLAGYHLARIIFVEFFY